MFLMAFLIVGTFVAGNGLPEVPLPETDGPVSIC